MGAVVRRPGRRLDMNTTAPISDGKLNIRDGVQAAILWGLLGAIAATIVVAGVELSERWLLVTELGEYHQWFQATLASAMWPMIGAGVVFASAGWVAGSAQPRVGIGSPLVIILLVSLAAWFIIGISEILPQRLKSIDHPQIYISEFLSMILPPLVVAVLLTFAGYPSNPRHGVPSTDSALDRIAMTRISSQMTFFHKRVFPTMWFGSVSLIFCVGTSEAIGKQQFVNIIPAVVVPLFMAIFGYFFMNMMHDFDLVDEVWDCGESVLIRNRGHEFQFGLSDFMGLSYTEFGSTARVTLWLSEKSEGLGKGVVFILPYQFSFHMMPPIARDLMERIDEAQRNTA
jgi:hypothetical protein